MKPAAFDMVRPRSVDEVVALLATSDDAKLLAGGQSLVPAMNFRLAAPALLIDLNRVEGLAGIRRDGAWLRIGAMTRQRALMESDLVAAHAPLMRQAMPHVGHVQTRARGTIGGSLAHADPSAELPLVTVALDAVFTLQSRGASREVAAREFFAGAMMTALQAHELLTEIAIPLAPEAARCSFREASRRHGDFAIVAVAAQFSQSALTLAIGGLEAQPRHCAGLIAALAAQHFAPRGLAALIAAELAGVEPLSDVQASGDYRRSLAAVLIEDCLGEVLAR